MRKVKIAFGAVAPTVVRARKIEQLLSGQRLTEERVQKAMEMAQKEVQPITDIRSTEDYRRKMAAVLLKRGLLKLTGEL